MSNKPELNKIYEPHEVERKWYHHWWDQGYFKPDNSRHQPDNYFSMVIPPPNVTGSLHMGHALNNTVQDILTRYHRMTGKAVLWVPGTDHAGIATQNVVERQLRVEGKKKEDLGREAFVERVWKWKEESGGTITSQLKRLGASCDWSRERFTMDEGCSKAVREVFVRLYEKELIYKGFYIINWCPRCLTALSDIEVEHQESAGHLWEIFYPLVDNAREGMVVATTRPETLLGDTAVAVHPDDERYQHLIGKKVILPLAGRDIPVIADPYVDREFGTGVVKITPAHDPNDFEMGRRYKLPELNVMNADGTMNEFAGKYRGMDRFEAREAILTELKELSLLKEAKDHHHAVGHCYRCKTVVEPRLSEQWFVKMQPLAEPAIAAVKENRIQFVPQRWEKVYFDWLENIRDWCISRQLWWGHQIPAWTCQFCGHLTVSVEDPDKCPKCGDKNIVQDPDVLDTWFSSQLWPLETLGWPQETDDLKKYYPTGTLVTGFDIIFFWVARMIMMGLEFKKEVPFKTVYIHGLVRDITGKKMSKSIGNVIDPVVMIDKFGTDALRFTLTSLITSEGQDIKLSDDRIEASRNFANKLWNASRFVLMNLEGFDGTESLRSPVSGLQSPSLELADRWILATYGDLVRRMNDSIKGYNFGEGANSLYRFIWNDFCDWYIELCKSRLYGNDPEAKKTAQSILFYVLEGSLRLLHPFMPFITEEIWQNLKLFSGEKTESIMLASYPALPEGEKLVSAISKDELETANHIFDIIRAIRNLRAEMNIPPGRVGNSLVVSPKVQAIEKGRAYIENLAKVKLTLQQELAREIEKAAVAVVGETKVYLQLAGLIDFDKEKQRLEKELARLKSEVDRLEKKLGNKGFTDKAPPEVVAEEKDKLATYIVQHETVDNQLKMMK